MYKKIPEKYKTIISIILILMVFTLSGFVFFFHLKNNYLNEKYQRVENTINFTRNYLFEQYAQNNQSLTSSERFIKYLFENSNFIQLDSSKTVKITAQKKNQSFYKSFELPFVKIQNFSGNSPESFTEKHLYLTNVFCEIWQRSGNNFIRIASGKPADKNKFIFIDINEEPAKTIINGSESYQNIQTKSDIQFKNSFPIYYKGKIRFFITLQKNKSFLSSLKILSQKEYNNILIINKKENVIFGLNKNNSFPKELNLQKNVSVISKNLNSKNFDKKTIYFRYIPELSIYIGNIRYSSDTDVYSRKLKQNFFILILILSIFTILLYIYILHLNRKKQGTSLNSLAHILPDKKYSQQTFEGIIQSFKEYYSEIQKITSDIANKNYTTEINDQYKNDKLFQNFASIQDSFLKNEQQEKKKLQELELKSKFDKVAIQISETLQYASNIESLSFKIIKKISEFTGAEQIAMFVVNENLQKEKSLQMTASYAYSKQRSVHKELKTNEGLIGMVYLEKKPVFLTEIPENYTFIESGYGFQKPKCLFIFPLIFNNDVQAIVELGSINIIDEQQINFLKDISENIASTIANLKHSKQTEILLAQTTKQSEQIETQRKTLEEKINTHRKQNRNLDKQILQLIEIIDSIKSVSYLIEYDLTGNIMDVSSKTVNLFNADKEDFISKSHKDLIIDAKYNDTYKTFWDDLGNNKTQYIEETLFVGNNKFKLKQTYVPIRNVRRKIYRFLSIGTIID